uniref:Rho GTPase-activating protein 10 n=1 Tax=Denticeps clupeoides TaxID=299321 RepID=A0AAY4A329_9TELE
MGLHPLEFSESYLDSPSFREKVKAHEAELDKTNRFIKELYKDGKNLINATKQLAMAQRKFAQCLGEFQFEYIGDAKTDDERCIDESLQEFSSFLRNLEDQRELMCTDVHLPSLWLQAERKKYEKETEKYYSSLEKLLNMSSKKKEPQLQEADGQVETNRQHFQELSLEYVCKLQEIQERKKFECVEPMLAFFQTVFTFYHQGYELAKDFDHYKRALQINIQNTRSRFEATRSEVYELMKKIKDSPQEYRQTSPITSEGYLYVQEKRPPPFGSSWVKRYCTFVKEQKILHMATYDHRSGGKIGETESVMLKSCVRKTTDVLDRRFCLDIETTDRPGTVVTVQALSEDDHKFWMQAMGGREPVSPLHMQSIDTQLDEVGFSFVKNSINAIEKRGINDQGLFRVVGVSSKVQKLLSLMMDEKSSEVDLSVSDEWDVKTITSALKLYLRLDTHLLCHQCFSTPSPESGSPEARLQAIHCLVHKLPEKNRLVLGLLMNHLANVAANSKQNLMTMANLGVVFGPTLMRSEEETVAAIMDLKFQNIVVEILIEQHEKSKSHTPHSHSPTHTPHSLPITHTPHSLPITHTPHSLPITHTPHSLPITRTPHSLTITHTTSLTHNHTHPSLTQATHPARTHKHTHPSHAQAHTPRTHASNTPRTHAQAHTPSLTQSLTYTHPALTQARTYTHPARTTPPTHPARTQTQTTPVNSRKAKAMYPCEAEHDSELSFQVGAIFHDVTVSREPGWLEGELEGKRGLIPENYVELL